MERVSITPRNKWQETVENMGFGFHTTASVPYWKEDAYYKFKLEEILKIEKASLELWEMCLEAVQYVIDNNMYGHFNIPKEAIPMIERSWNEDHPSIYGRFDFGYDGKNLKLFEFNADTPTSLFEGGIVQWFWLKDIEKVQGKEIDQFNSIDDKMRDYWSVLKNYLYPGKLYFTCIRKSLEDLTTTEYIRDLAIQAGIETELMFIDEIGWDKEQNCFVDPHNKPIKNIFKLYPWEWMVREDFAEQVENCKRMYWIEPAWKMILSNKAILAVLWEMFPRCPYILEAHFSDNNKLKSYVKKPLLSREGQNVSIVREGEVIEETRGEYGDGTFICQELFDLPSFDGKRPVLGSWIIGQQSAGMGIRETDNLITGNTSCFIPHLIED